MLKALQEKLLRQDLFEEFCHEFTREMNRLRMEHRATLTAAEREIEKLLLARVKYFGAKTAASMPLPRARQEVS